jgi:DNA (cytosine-5)-methyltransferase 1
MRILDLFCGAGGAAMGYHRAGFEVVGVDINPQPHYPFEFHRADALTFPLDGFDAIHASPPCQQYSVTRHVNSRVHEYPDLVGSVRDLLSRAGLPYILENVPGAPLLDPVMLCGSMFGLVAYWPESQQQKWVELRRHRLFETNWPLKVEMDCDHRYPAMPVYGHGVGGNRVSLKGPGQARLCREVMGIHWMSRLELDESIPPAYTHYIGGHLMASLERKAA